MNRVCLLVPVTALLVGSACQDPTFFEPSSQRLTAFAASATAGLKLHPNGFGEASYAAWKAKEGLPDSKGNANHGLYFQKMTTTATFAAGVASVHGLEGSPLSELTGLSWEHRIDGWCGAGAPRWDVIVADAEGDRGVVFLGCAAAVHSPGTNLNWIRDSYAGPAIAAAPAFGFTLDFDATDPLTIDQLLIVFDEGTDVPANPGFVVLDNIVVNTTMFTGPADNGGS